MAYNQNLEFNGLGTLSTSVPVAGPYFIKGKISLPTIVNGAGASAVVATVNQNGSPIYTGLAGAEGFFVNFLGAANDTIAVVLTSANSVDAGLNVVLSTVSIGSGQ